MAVIRFAPRAVADLEEIKRYISDDLFNPKAAEDLVSLVFDKIGMLASMPRSGAQLKTDLPMLKDYRFITCNNYLVFYRVETNHVSIIRILHSRRDYTSLIE